MIEFLRRIFRRTPTPRPINGWITREYQRRLREIMSRHVERCATLKRVGIFDQARADRELDEELDRLTRDYLG